MASLWPRKTCHELSQTNSAIRIALLRDWLETATDNFLNGGHQSEMSKISYSPTLSLSPLRFKQRLNGDEEYGDDGAQVHHKITALENHLRRSYHWAIDTLLSSLKLLVVRF